MTNSLNLYHAGREAATSSADDPNLSNMTNIPQDWEIIELFDSTNLTVAQVASHFGVTTYMVKRVLMAQDDWND